MVFEVSSDRSSAATTHVWNPERAQRPTIIPVSMRILGDDARLLRQEAEKLQALLKTSPFALNVRDDWGNDAIRPRLEIDQDRAVASRSLREPLPRNGSLLKGDVVETVRELKNQSGGPLLVYGSAEFVETLSRRSRSPMGGGPSNDRVHTLVATSD